MWYWILDKLDFMLEFTTGTVCVPCWLSFSCFCWLLSGIVNAAILICQGPLCGSSWWAFLPGIPKVRRTGKWKAKRLQLWEGVVKGKRRTEGWLVLAHQLPPAQQFRTGCGIIIGKEVRALQCDRCCQQDCCKCIECLDITGEVYDTLIECKELCWFCKSC